MRCVAFMTIFPRLLGHITVRHIQRSCSKRRRHVRMANSRCAMIRNRRVSSIYHIIILILLISFRTRNQIFLPIPNPSMWSGARRGGNHTTRTRAYHTIGGTWNGNKKWRKQGEEGGKLPFHRPIVTGSDLEWIIQNDDAILGQLIPTSAQDFNTPTMSVSTTFKIPGHSLSFSEPIIAKE